MLQSIPLRFVVPIAFCLIQFPFVLRAAPPEASDGRAALEKLLADPTDFQLLNPTRAAFRLEIDQGPDRPKIRVYGVRKGTDLPTIDTAFALLTRSGIPYAYVGPHGIGFLDVDNPGTRILILGYKASLLGILDETSGTLRLDVQLAPAGESQFAVPFQQILGWLSKHPQTTFEPLARTWTIPNQDGRTATVRLRSPDSKACFPIAKLEVSDPTNHTIRFERIRTFPLNLQGAFMDHFKNNEPPKRLTMTFRKKADGTVETIQKTEEVPREVPLMFKYPHSVETAPLLARLFNWDDRYWEQIDNSPELRKAGSKFQSEFCKVHELTPAGVKLPEVQAQLTKDLEALASKPDLKHQLDSIRSIRKQTVGMLLRNWIWHPRFTIYALKIAASGDLQAYPRDLTAGALRDTLEPETTRNLLEALERIATDPEKDKTLRLAALSLLGELGVCDLENLDRIRQTVDEQRDPDLIAAMAAVQTVCGQFKAPNVELLRQTYQDSARSEFVRFLCFEALGCLRTLPEDSTTVDRLAEFFQSEDRDHLLIPRERVLFAAAFNGACRQRLREWLENPEYAAFRKELVCALTRATPSDTPEQRELAPILERVLFDQSVPPDDRVTAAEATVLSRSDFETTRRFMRQAVLEQEPKIANVAIQAAHRKDIAHRVVQEMQPFFSHEADVVRRAAFFWAFEMESAPDDDLTWYFKIIDDIMNDSKNNTRYSAASVLVKLKKLGIKHPGDGYLSALERGFAAEQQEHTLSHLYKQISELAGEPLSFGPPTAIQTDYKQNKEWWARNRSEFLVKLREWKQAHPELN